MRVVLVCLSDFRAPGARQTMRLADALKRHGHETIVLIEGDPDSIRFADEAELDIPFDQFRFVGPRLDRRTRDRVVQFAPDVVHCYEPRTSPLSAALQLSEATDAALCVRFADDDETLAKEAGGSGLRGLLGRPLLLAAGTVIPKAWPYKHPYFYRKMFKRANGFDAITPALAEAIEDRYSVNCEAILPAISGNEPPQPVPGLREKLKLPVDAKLILYTGSVFRAQFPDLELLLRAFATVAAEVPEAHLVHTGRIAPRYSPEFLKGLTGPGASRVHLMGFLEDPKDLSGLLADASVLVQPGAPSDFNRLRLPAKVHDYLLAERPTVTFEAGFGELLEDRVEAIMTQTDSAEELAQSIIWTLADEARAEAIAKAGRTKALELFDPRRIAERTSSYYEKAISRRKA